MEIVFEERDGACDCALSGELDMYESPAFQERCETRLRSSKGGAFLVDLSGLTFADSSGLGALFRVFCLARELSVGFCLYGARGMVSSLLRLSRMSSILPLEADYGLARERAGGMK